MSNLVIPESAGDDTERLDPFSGLGLERDTGGDKFAGLGLEHADTNRQDPFAGLGLERETDAQDEAAAQRNIMLLNFRTGKLDPEQARQAYADMQRTNLPQSTVLSHHDKIRDMLEERDLDAFGMEAPLTAGWMAQDIIRTNIARDDAHTLKGIEGLVQGKGTWELAKEAYTSSSDMMQDIAIFERHMSGDRSPELMEMMQSANARRKTSTQKPDGLWQEFAVNTAEQLPIQEAILGERGKGYLIGASSGAFFGSAVPVIGTIAGAAGGTFAGGAAYAANAAYRMESAFAYGDFLQAGIPEDAAGIAARVYGVGAAVIEFADSLIDTSILGLSLNSAGKQSAKMTLKSALGGLIKNIAIGKGSETVEEMAQQGLQIAVGEVTKLLTDTKSGMTLDAAKTELLEVGWKTFWSAWGAESGTIRFAMDVRDARNGGGAAYVRDMALAAGQQREQEILSSLDDLSSNSKLAQRDPGLYEEAVRAMSQGGAVQNVYIPAGGLSAAFGGTDAMQDAAAQERLGTVLDLMGVTTDEYGMALASGDHLIIPAEKYAAAVAQDKEFAALIVNDRRLTPDGFTVREKMQWVRDNESSLREAVDTANMGDTQSTQWESETREVSWAVQAQLEAAGQPRDVAAANAAQMAAVFGTLSQRSGTSPMQLWGMYAPDVAQEGGLTVEAGEVLPTGEAAGAQQQGEYAQGGIEALARDVEQWHRGIDSIVAQGVAPSAPHLMLHQTPLVMQMLGAKERPIYAAPHLFDGTHPNITADMLKELPQALADPVAIFQSKTHKDRLVFMLEMTDASGATVVLPVQLDGTKYRATIHIATTVYAKNKRGLPDNEWFAKQAGNALYINRAKEKRWLMVSGSNSLWDAASVSSDANIRTEAELVNLRQQNPSMYSGGEANPRGRISFSTPSGRSLITLFQQADASTFLHESGHLYLEMLRSLAEASNAAPQLTAMWQEAREVLGRDTGGVITDATGNISTQAHELWASSLENYFMKGEAPSMALRGVFQKFGAWLKAIYNAFRSLGVSPAEGLNAVFQRLLATDAQIAEVEQWHEAQKPWAELTNAQAASEVAASADRDAKRKAEADNRAGKSLEQLKEEAAAEARAKRLKTLTNAYTSALGGRTRFTAEAEAAVNAMPVYAAMDEAAKGVGLDMGTVAALMGEERAKALGKKRVALLRLEGGDDPLILAAKHGFDSTEAMLDAMLESEGKGKLVKRMSAQAEQQARDTIAQGVAEQETMPGDVEYHSEAQLAVLLAEKRLLDEKTRLAGYRQQAKDSALEAAALTEAARETIATLPVAQATQAHRYSLAERRAAKAAWAEAKAGNWDKAAQHKRQEAVSHALYLAAADARAHVDKAKKDVKKLIGNKFLTADARDIMSDVAYRFGFMAYEVGSIADSYSAWKAAALRDGRTFPSLTQWAEEVSKNGYPVFIEDFILNAGPAQDYRQLSMEQFESVEQAIRNVYTVDRKENTALLNGKRVELSELAAALHAAAAKNKSPVERDKYAPHIIKEGLGNFHAYHAKMEAILLNLDGWKHGVWWESFFKPIADAEDAQNVMLEGMNEKLRSLANAMMPSVLDKRAFFNDRIFIKGTGGKKGMTMNEIVSAALNAGNGVNKQRMLEGEGWTQETLDSVLSHMDENHRAFVVGVWEYFETFKEESFALQREITGITPKAVEAMPFTATTADGKTLSFPGGYYPIKYSAKHGDKAFSREQKELDAQLFGGRNYGAAMTKHGHLKERQSRGTGERLNLDIGVVADHLYNTAHDISHRKAVIEVAKLMRHKGIKEIINTYAGPEMAKQFQPWIQDVANEMQSKDSMGWLHKSARWARRGSSIMAMGLKVTTAYVQITGFTQSAAVLGPQFTAIGYHKAWARDGSIFKQAASVRQQSTFMKNRLNSFDREVRDATKNVTLRGNVLGNTEKIAYLPMGLMQFYGVDVPTWLGAQAKALSEGKSDTEAAAYADSIVRLTQTSGSIKDMSRIQRGSEVERLFTMFYSFFSALYQLAWRAGAVAKNKGFAKGSLYMAGQALLLWFMPAVISELMTGRGPDEDDGEEWGPWMTKKIAVYPAQMLIGVRDLTNALAAPEFGYRGSPAFGSPQSIVRFALSVQKAVEEDDPSVMTKPAVRMAGHLFMLPLGQPMITIGNMYDYMTGETPDFQLRDLFFVKQKSRR